MVAKSGIADIKKQRHFSKCIILVLDKGFECVLQAELKPGAPAVAPDLFKNIVGASIGGGTCFKAVDIVASEKIDTKGSEIRGWV